MIGAGAVGLAIARKLAERDGTSTLLLERHGAVGTETSSRNSEVYFPLLAIEIFLIPYNYPGHPCRHLLRSKLSQNEAMSPWQAYDVRSL